MAPLCVCLYVCLRGAMFLVAFLYCFTLDEIERENYEMRSAAYSQHEDSGRREKNK